MSPPAQFDYLNTYYRMSLAPGAEVMQDSVGKVGTVTRATGPYIMIKWRGEDQEQGPYHPLADMVYRDPAVMRPKDQRAATQRA